MRRPTPSIKRPQESQQSEASNTIHRTLRLFRSVCRHLPLRSDPCLAAINPIRPVGLKAQGRFASSLHPPALLGTVPGVEVGDEFFYRIELAIVRLHRPMENRIDYDTNSGLTTSIVVSGKYMDSWNLSDGLLSYSGMGGYRRRRAEPRDQKMEKGNLAMKRCVEARKPVRVIYGIREFKRDTAYVFFYDGLYIVEGWRRVIGSNDCFSFEFQLRRIEGQPHCRKWEAQLEKKTIWQRKKLQNGCDSGKGLLVK